MRRGYKQCSGLRTPPRPPALQHGADAGRIQYSPPSLLLHEPGCPGRFTIHDHKQVGAALQLADIHRKFMQ